MTTTAARIRALALTVALAAGLSLVPATAALASGPGSATFTVTAEGSPVAGQAVFAFGADFAFGTTDEAGIVTLSDLALGDYTLSISSFDYPSIEVPFTLTAESPSVAQDVVLVPWPVGTGVVSGTVVDRATGNPIPGVDVQASPTTVPGRYIHTTTDANGQYSLEGLVEASYDIVANVYGHFLGFASIVAAEGGASTVNFALLAADATIEGRVVDSNGVGVAGIQLTASSADGSTIGTSAEDGYYSLSGAGAGAWTVYAYATAEWETSSVAVTVPAGGVATATDIVLVPRFTGTISGVVASSDGIPEAERGGFFDVCVTALSPEGAEVPGATTVTGGDGFYFFYLAPGDYTVSFEDCDADRQPHGYQSTYLGGSATLAGATIVSVETLVDTWLDTTVLTAATGDPEPDHDAVPVAKNKLKKATEDLIDAPDQVHPGDTFEVVVGIEYSGDWVSAWTYGEPTQVGGWHLVAADGSIEVTLAADAKVGHQRLSVQNADDELIGWTGIDVKKVKKH